ncbi:MAG: alkaline phosphatase family protein [Oscillospiraceae bacterium]|nr:alkaline phosphatase family protein [Oscillospiraceae bacterium]
MQLDYDNSIVSLTNAILAHYGAAPHHSPLPYLEDLLAQNHKNVVLLVLDGMGVNVLERNLPESSFLRSHIKTELSSVYPCTTTAATTSFLSGKTPAEHGWLGWSCYFQEVDRCIDLFSGNESGTGRPAAKEHLPNRLLAYDSIFKQIEQAANKKVKTFFVSPFSKPFADTMEGICTQIKKLGKKRGRKYIYAYHFQPDKDMHDHGVSAPRIGGLLKEYDRQLEQLCAKLSGTLLLITADHGMADITMHCVEDYPALHGCLRKPVSVEPRACSFFVKETHMADFPGIFQEAFGEKFRLYTHNEFLDGGFLGNGQPHRKTAEFVGDFVAVAVADAALWYRDINTGAKNFKGAHAGLTEAELTVPLIVLECPAIKKRF